MKELWKRNLSPTTRLILQTGINATDVPNVQISNGLIILQKNRLLRFPLIFDYKHCNISPNAIRKRFYKETNLTIIESRILLLTEIHKIDPELAENWLIQKGVINVKRMFEVLGLIFLY